MVSLLTPTGLAVFPSQMRYGNTPWRRGSVDSLQTGRNHPLPLLKLSRSQVNRPGFLS